MAEQILIEITNQCATQEMDLSQFFVAEEDATIESDELDDDIVDMIDVSLNIDVDDDDVNDDISKTLDKFKCIIKSVDDAVKDSKIVEVTSQWEVTRKFLEVFFNRINACKNIEDETEQSE